MAVSSATMNIISGSGLQGTHHSVHPSGTTWGRCRWLLSTGSTLHLTAGFLLLLRMKATYPRSATLFRFQTVPISASLHRTLMLLLMVSDSGLLLTRLISA